MGPGVRPLAVESGWVVEFEKDVQQLLQREDRGIESNLDGFRMAGVPFTNLVIGWVLDVTVGVAANDGLDAFDALEDDFRAPEASRTEGNGFHFLFGGRGRFGRFFLRFVGAARAAEEGGGEEKKEGSEFHGT